MNSIKLGNNPMSFVYQGSELLYPNPIKDGLLLWYDFKDVSNASPNKEVARDLSGNNNNGTLQNFAYTNGSGYIDGLKFDNVDDEVSTNVFLDKSFTLSLTLDMDFSADVQFFSAFSASAFYIRRNYNALHCSVYTDKQISSTSGGNLLFYKMQQNNQNKVVVTMSVDDNTKKLKLYGNDELLSTVDTVISIAPVSLIKLGKWNSGSTNLTGKILSAIAYNRALTDREIQHNYKIEKERWGL
ncbi:hypothetical protein [Mammaliicoccus sciuri]|uniref:hypothetical protein n=1 Tax=Mammaliicoccus sciuri TaxID=1296 RepID=UPI002B263DC5|nr:hypothetical protein [Mammaliicoccus sciuri]WQK75132.1 hypothetical protein P3U33_05225 [Mammaliicoccus sciuri]